MSVKNTLGHSRDLQRVGTGHSHSTKTQGELGRALLGSARLPGRRGFLTKAEQAVSGDGVPLQDSAFAANIVPTSDLFSGKGERSVAYDRAAQGQRLAVAAVGEGEETWTGDDDLGPKLPTTTLERPPSVRPVVAGASLRSLRSVEDLQQLQNGQFSRKAAPMNGQVPNGNSPLPGPSPGRMHAAARAAEISQPAFAAVPNEQGVPVFVMMPLDTVNQEGVFRYASSPWFSKALEAISSSGVRGAAVDVWWGAVEKHPGRYDWSGYRQLFEMIKSQGLKLQVVMSFHACGGNVGDYAQVPLPKWVLKCGEHDPDLFFTDRPRNSTLGQRNKEYISIFADDAPRALRGRSPLECYRDFMRAFRDAFVDDLGSHIEEVVVGTGPCGELRYPSYVEANGWRFPGVGEFQCFDRRALASLAAAAQQKGHPEWGYSGPHDSGTYTSTPEATDFFRSWGGSWETPYGQFFLEWYSSNLADHGKRLLKAAVSIFNVKHPQRCTISNHQDSTQSIVTTGYASPVQLHLANVAEDPHFVTSPGGSNSDEEPSMAGQPTELAADVTSDIMVTDRSVSNLSTMSTSTSDSQEPQDDMFEAVPRMRRSTDLLASLDEEEATAPAAEPSSTQMWGPPLRRPQKSISLVSLYSEEGITALASTRSEDGRAFSQFRDYPAGRPVEVTLKIAGIHWWYRARSHAAELTAGYYNTDTRDGYNGLVEMCAELGVSMTLTCVEMCDAQHPPEALCGPEGLLRQVREACAAAGVTLAGENALPVFAPNGVDLMALDRIVYNTSAWAPPLQEEAKSDFRVKRNLSNLSLASSYATGGSTESLANAAMGGDRNLPHTGSGGSADTTHKGLPNNTELPQSMLPMMRTFTFLRLTPEMVSPAYQGAWMRFMHRMQNNGVKDMDPASLQLRGPGYPSPKKGF